MRTVTENWARLNALAVKEGHDEISLHIMVSGLGKMANYPLESMNYVGYSFDDLIISCTYGTLSKKCDESNTHIFTHHEMNNCYILRLDTSEFSKAGPQNGLTLLLYIGQWPFMFLEDSRAQLAWPLWYDVLKSYPKNISRSIFCRRAFRIASTRQVIRPIFERRRGQRMARFRAREEHGASFWRQQQHSAWDVNFYCAVCHKGQCFMWSGIRTVTSKVGGQHSWKRGFQRFSPVVHDHTFQVSRLPHPYTDCSQDKNIPGTDYLMDVHTCKERCLMNAVRGKCGCFPSDLVFNRSNLDAKYCLWYNEEDPLQVFRTYNCEKTLRHQFETHMDDYPEALKCVRQCKWRCKEIEFESASSLSVFPTREAMAWFYSTYLYNNPRNHSLLAWQHYLDDIKNPNKTAEDFSFSWRSRIGFSAVDDKLADWLSSSFARVHVYFATSETMKQIQKPSETVTQPLANIGGSVGLWAGLSILSVVEFVLTLYKNKAKHEKGCKSIVPAHLTT